MNDRRFRSPLRFFSEALIYTVGLCGSIILAAYVQDMHLSLWWMLLAFLVLFCVSCYTLMLSGYVIVEPTSDVTAAERSETQ